MRFYMFPEDRHATKFSFPNSESSLVIIEFFELVLWPV
jgi:hypothetical protein